MHENRHRYLPKPSASEALNKDSACDQRDHPGQSPAGRASELSPSGDFDRSRGQEELVRGWSQRITQKQAGASRNPAGMRDAGRAQHASSILAREEESSIGSMLMINKAGHPFDLSAKA